MIVVQGLFELKQGFFSQKVSGGEMVGQSLMVDYVIMEFEFKDQRLKSMKVSLNYSKWFKKKLSSNFYIKN